MNPASLKPYYYYEYDNLRRPRVTVCLLCNGDPEPVPISRGIAICSDLDMPRKKTGRQIALGRALSALKRRETGDRMIQYEAWLSGAHFISEYKREFQPKLTDKERAILYGWKEAA